MRYNRAINVLSGLKPIKTIQHDWLSLWYRPSYDVFINGEEAGTLTQELSVISRALLANVIMQNTHIPLRTRGFYYITKAGVVWDVLIHRGNEASLCRQFLCYWRYKKCAINFKLHFCRFVGNRYWVELVNTCWFALLM